MKTQISSRQLSRKWQALLAQRLSGWIKYGTYGLYRRTEDFVQWLVLDPSAYEPILRVHYTIQTLAEQFPAADLTLGGIVRNSQGGELRLNAELIVQDVEQTTTAIMIQIAPAITDSFSAESVAQFLDTRQFTHVSAFVGRGIAAVALGDKDLGQHLFRVAFAQYQQMTATWARPLEARVHKWLEIEDKELLNQLRRDALVGAELLRLK